MLILLRLGVVLLALAVILVLVVGAYQAVTATHSRSSDRRRAEAAAAERRTSEITAAWDAATDHHERVRDAYVAYWVGPQSYAEQTVHRPLIAQGLLDGDPEVVAFEEGYRTLSEMMDQGRPGDVAAARRAQALAAQVHGKWEALYDRAGREGGLR